MANNKPDSRLLELWAKAKKIVLDRHIKEVVEVYKELITTDLSQQTMYDILSKIQIEDEETC